MQDVKSVRTCGEFWNYLRQSLETVIQPRPFSSSAPSCIWCPFSRMFTAAGVSCLDYNMSPAPCSVVCVSLPLREAPCWSCFLLGGWISVHDSREEIYPPHFTAPAVVSSRTDTNRQRPSFIAWISMVRLSITQRNGGDSFQVVTSTTKRHGANHSAHACDSYLETPPIHRRTAPPWDRHPFVALLQIQSPTLLVSLSALIHGDGWLKRRGRQKRNGPRTVGQSQKKNKKPRRPAAAISVVIK